MENEKEKEKEKEKENQSPDPDPATGDNSLIPIPVGGRRGNQWGPYKDQDRNTHEGRRTTTTSIIETTGLNFTDAERAIRQQKFLEAYEMFGTLRAGCDAAQVSRMTVRDRWMADPQFAARFQDAKDNYEDRLEEEAMRRGAVGVTRTKRVYYKGELVDAYPETEYSDTLLMFHMKKRIPAYREQQGTQSGDGAIPWEEVAKILAAEKAAEGLEAPTPTPSTPVDGDNVIEGSFVQRDQSNR